MCSGVLWVDSDLAIVVGQPPGASGGGEEQGLCLPAAPISSVMSFIPRGRPALPHPPGSDRRGARHLTPEKFPLRLWWSSARARGIGPWSRGRIGPKDRFEAPRSSAAARSGGRDANALPDRPAAALPLSAGWRHAPVRRPT